MADTIKEFYNGYKALDELGVQHTAFTNDANTTRIIKNINIHSITEKHLVDLFIDDIPVYRKLPVEADGTIKLENENLVVGPNSSLKYMASCSKRIKTNKILDEYSSTASYAAYQSRQGDVFYIQEGTSNTIITLNKNGAQLASIQTSFNGIGTRVTVKYFEDDNYVYIGILYPYGSLYDMRNAIYKYSKETNKITVSHIEASTLYTSNSSYYDYANIVFKVNPFSQTVYCFMTGYQYNSIAVYELSDRMNGITYTRTTINGITDSTNGMALDVVFVSATELAMIVGNGETVLFNQATGTITNGTISTTSPIYDLYHNTMVLLSNGNIAIKGGTTGGYIDIFNSTLTTKLATTVSQAYIYCFMSPQNELIGVRLQDGLIYDILDASDLSVVKSFFAGKNSAVTNSSMYLYAGKTIDRRPYIDEDNFTFTGLVDSRASITAYDLHRISFYNGITLKIDGVEITNA